MKRLFAAVGLFVMMVSAGAAAAQDGDAMHKMGGLGFHSIEAPLGLRWWFSGQKIAIDLGVGFSSTPSGIDPDEKEMGFAIEAGVPFVAHSWEKVHFLIRPGLLYESQEIGFDSDPGTPGLQYDTETATAFTVVGELEAEVFLADNLSVSASHGIGFVSVDPGFGADSQTAFGTFGNNFTNIGFHAYIF